MNDSVKSLVEVSTRTINGKEVLAVTSLQVAEHFGKEHKHVLRDIRIILEADEDGFSESNFGLSSYLTEQNKEMPMYVMSKDGFVLLVMGYTGPEAMRMKKAYIARFKEMEEQLRAASPLLPNFRDPIAAAEAWIVAERARLAEQARADYYQRTKAEIGSRREATAMATASVAVRKVNALEDELGRGKRYKSVKAIPWLLTEFVESKGMYSVVGKALKRMSTDLGYSIEKIATPEYPEGINAYHVDVISAFRCELAQNPGMLDRYRKRRAA